jgi:hypothetical protein
LFSYSNDKNYHGVIFESVVVKNNQLQLNILFHKNLFTFNLKNLDENKIGIECEFDEPSDIVKRLMPSN